MTTIEVEVDPEMADFLHALSVVRGVPVSTLLTTAVRHLRVTQAERQQVTIYRWTTTKKPKRSRAVPGY